MQAIGDFVSVNRDIVARVLDLFRGLAPKGRTPKTVILRIDGKDIVNPWTQWWQEYMEERYPTAGA